MQGSGIGNILYHHRTQGIGAEGAHVRGMVDAFRGLGWRVKVIGPPGVDLYAEQQGESAKKERWSLKRVWFQVSEYFPQMLFEVLEFFYNFHACRALLACLRKERYGLIYERYALNTVAGTLLAKASGVPLILEVNDATVIERTRPLCFKGVARWVERWVFSRAHLIITISERFKKLIVECHGIGAEKILVLPNAIEPRRYDLAGRKKLTRDELNVPKDAVVVGCAGAFVPWHGLEFFLEAVGGRVRQDGLFLLFIGDGPVRQCVEEAASRLGIRDRLLFTGFVPFSEVPGYLDLLDIAVIPGSNEHGSPMKLFECMAMGKPIVLPEYQPLLETVSDGEEALFFPPGDGVRLRNCLGRLAADPVLRRAMGQRARKTVMTHHIWEMHAEKVLAVTGLTGAEGGALG